MFDGDSGAELGRIANADMRGAYITAGDQFFATSLGGELVQYDIDTFEPIRSYGGSLGFIQELYGTSDGSMIAVRGGDRRVVLYDVATGVRIGQPIVIPDDESNLLAFSIDGSTLAIGGEADAGVKVWDLDPEHWVGSRLPGRRPQPHPRGVGDQHRRSRRLPPDLPAVPPRHGAHVTAAAPLASEANPQ